MQIDRKVGGRGKKSFDLRNYLLLYKEELNLFVYSEEASTKENWERYYWDAIKRTFGFGYFM